MKNLTFKAAMLKGSQPTVNRQSTDGQSQRHCKQTPLSKRWKVLMTLVFLFTLAIGQMWAKTWTAANIVAGNVTEDNVTVTTSASSVANVNYYKPSGTQTKADVVQVTGNCNGGTLANIKEYIEIKASANCYLDSPIKIKGAYSGGTTQKALAFLGWNGDAADNGVVLYEGITFKGCDQATLEATEVTLSFTENISTIRIYTRSKVNTTTHELSSSGTQKGAGSTVGILEITATATPVSSDPVCPTTVTISGTKSYTEGQKITLNAATNGNGDLTYQWYKGGKEEANKLTGKTAAKLEIEGCTTANAGNYYCFVGKTACGGAFNAEAYAVEVIEAPVSGDASDLVTISSAYTFTPTETLTKNYLYYGKKLLAINNDLTYGSNKLTLNTGRRLAFKVNAGAYVKITFDTNGTREVRIGTADGGTDLAHSNASPITAIREEVGVVYVSASGELKMSKLEISYPTLYTVTYDLNGGTVKSGETAPSEGKKIEGDQFTVAGNAAFDAPEGKEFGGWNDGTSDYAAGDTYTVGTSNVVLKAIWNTPKTPLTISWTTAPADGNAGTDADVTLAVDKGASTGAVTFSSSNESVAKIVDGNKLHYVGAGTATITANVATDETYEAASIEKEIKVTAYCGAAYAEWTLPINTTTFTSFSKADNGIAATVTPVQSDMTVSKATANNTMTVGIASTNAEGYIAFTFTVPEGKEFVPCNVLLNVQPIAANCGFTLVVEDNQGSEALSIDKADMASGQLKPIELTNAGSKAFSGTVSIKLYSTATTGNGYRLGKNVTIAGTLNNVTKYAVSFANGGADGSEEMAAVEYKAGATVVAPECGFTYTGHIFNGWTVTNVVGVTSVAAGGSFTMPGNPVTLTATWLANNYDAKIVETNTAYATLAAAIAAAEAGQTVQLLQDVEQADGVLINKNLVLDLNGKTYTCTNGNSYNNRAIKVTAGNVTIKNGTVDALSNDAHTGGCYGGLRIEGGNVTCEEVTFKNYRSYGLGIKALAGTLTMTDCSVISAIGGCLEVTNNGDEYQVTDKATATLNNCTFTQTGLDGTTYGGQAYISTCVAVSGGATVTVNSGTYTSAQGWALYVFDSSGKIIVNGGSFDGKIQADYNATELANAGNSSAKTEMEIKAGTFEHYSVIADATNVANGNIDINISGGTFDAPVAEAYCAENYAPKDNGDGTYGVKPLATSIDFEGYYVTGSHGTVAQALAAHHYTLTADMSDNNKVSWDNNSNAYDKGLKIKETGKTFSFDVAAGKLVTFKTGIISGATLSVNGGTAVDLTITTKENASIKTRYYYNADAQHFEFTTTTGSYNIIKSITIEDPYVVNYDATDGSCETASANYIGTALVLPTPTHATYSFKGWYDAPTDGNLIGAAGASYTPTASITLYAQWEAVSSDARLSAIEITPNTGVLAPAFNMELTEYTYTMPYGTAAIPTVTDATPNHEGATWYIESAATAWGETTIVRGKALSNDTKAYNITMLQAPKDGVAIISIDVPTGNGNVQTIAADNISGFIGGTATQKLQNGGTKLGGNGNYIGFTLANSEELQAGDVIRLNVSATNGASHLTLYQDGSDANLVKDIEWTATEGINLIPIPSEAVGLSTLYIYRKSSVCNPTLSEFAILRPMDPVMTAITINGRDGEIDPLDDKHFNVTIPYEADLAALTVEPTIVSNTAEASVIKTVESNDGAWVLAADGDNTYRIMDKDGDYTDYTITLTRDIKKYTVTFNAQGGSTVQSELVVAGEKLAAAPADPTREDYLFLGWAEAAEGEVVDVTDFVINADKEFYAQWKYEDPIKLIIDGTGNTKVLNSEKFYTGATLASGTVNVDEVTYKYATLSSTATTPVQNDKTKLIAYNATTTKTKLMVDVYNSSTSDRQVNIFAAREGSGEYETLATLALNNSDKKHVKTLYYEFNSNANEARTFYISVSSSASSVYFLQVKVIESGEPLKKAGEVGYSLNMNKGRMFDDDETIEGVTFDLSSAYKALDGGYVKITSSSTISFDITNPVTLSVETGNNKTYYVTRGAVGVANETALTGVSEFQLTEGKWFISGGSNEVQLKSIAFSAAKPVYTRENLNPANIGTLCVKYNGRLEGATLYELNGKNEYNKLVFDEVENNVMVAGRPYIFVPENGNTKIEVYKSNEEFAEEAGLFHGMQGTFVALSTITDGMSSPLWGNYIISNNKYIYVDAENCSLKENRAYILSLDQVPEETPAEPNTNGSPRRRVVMGGNPAPSVVTGFDNLNEAEAPMKVMIDGQMFIIRGEKMFDATGRLVK